MSNLKLNIKMTAAFTARNMKVFFRDKGAVISALMAPLVILLLYVLFLNNVLKSSFTAGLGDAVIPEKLIDGYIASFEVSSILAVCCVTVAFVVNMMMVDDRLTGVRADLDVTPTHKSVLVLGYFFSTALVTLSICLLTLAVGLAYIGASGWQMSAGDCLFAVLDVFLASLFGTALSSVVAVFLKSRGAINAVSTIVSTVYGFICGAYYPISQFAKGIANFVMCLPGTYFTALFRSHFMRCFYEPFTEAGMPSDAAAEILDSLDVNAYFFGKAVPTWVMYTVALCTVVALLAAFVAINAVKIKRKPKPVAPAAE